MLSHSGCKTMTIESKPITHFLGRRFKTKANHSTYGSKTKWMLFIFLVSKECNGMTIKLTSWVCTQDKMGIMMGYVRNSG